MKRIIDILSNPICLLKLRFLAALTNKWGYARCLLLYLLCFLSTLYAGEPFDTWIANYDTILKTYIAHGRVQGIDANLVDYASLRKDIRLRHLMRDLAHLPPFTELPEKEQLALWINAYNCILLKLIADNPTINSVNELDGLMRTIWKKKVAFVSHKKYSLSDIEHGIIRKYFKEPRAMFTLCSGTLSSPDLATDAYESSHLEEQLNRALKNFASNTTKGIKLSSDTLTISPLFQWYAVDFPPSPPEWLMHQGVIPSMHIAHENLKTSDMDYRFLRYFEYNWSLNEKK